MAAHAPRVQALKAVFAKSSVFSILLTKRSHVLLDDVAFHCERLVGVAQTKRFAKRCTRELKLVQLKDREHVRRPRQVAHHLKIFKQTAVHCSEFCRR